MKPHPSVLVRWLLPIAVVLLSLPVKADYEDGVLAAEKGDYATAFQEFSNAAEEGLDLAQYNLGVLYYLGRGVAQDYEQAFHWTLAAAEQGHTAAQFNLGALYYEGEGTRKDKTAAMEWYTRAGRAQNIMAQYNVAEMYFNGDGVKRDLVRAHAWATWAQENEHETAGDLVQRIESRLSDEELREARRQLARIKIGMDP